MGQAKMLNSYCNRLRCCKITALGMPYASVELESHRLESTVLMYDTDSMHQIV